MAAALTEIPGSSDVVDRGFVVYTNEAKTELLDVRDELLEQHGAVSEQVARAMAEGALLHSGAELSVAVYRHRGTVRRHASKAGRSRAYRHRARRQGQRCIRNCASVISAARRCA